GRLLGERPREHELSLEHGFRAVHDAVQGGGHPRNRRMLDVALHVPDLAAGIMLEPEAIELFRGPSELHDEVVREILRLGLAPFLAPKADQGGFIAAHDDAGVRAANKSATINILKEF